MQENAYQLQKAQNTCRKCGKKFEDGQVYTSTLQTDENGLWAREDFCRLCWKQCQDEVFSFWQTRRRHDSTTDNQMDENDVLSCFQDLNDKKDDRRTLELKYVLALYLTRKKVLKLTDIIQKGDGQENLVFEGPEKGQETHVKNPELSNERIKELTRNLRSLCTVSTAQRPGADSVRLP